MTIMKSIKDYEEKQPSVPSWILCYWGGEEDEEQLKVAYHKD